MTCEFLGIQRIDIKTVFNRIINYGNPSRYFIRGLLAVAKKTETPSMIDHVELGPMDPRFFILLVRKGEKGGEASNGETSKIPLVEENNPRPGLSYRDLKEEASTHGESSPASATNGEQLPELASNTDEYTFLWVLQISRHESKKGGPSDIRFPSAVFNHPLDRLIGRLSPGEITLDTNWTSPFANTRAPPPSPLSHSLSFTFRRG